MSPERVDDRPRRDARRAAPGADAETHGARLTAWMHRLAGGHARGASHAAAGARGNRATAEAAPELAAPPVRRGGRATVAAAAPRSRDELWQRRQLELLERIDENLKRLRELHESLSDRAATFTEPAN